MSTKSIGVTFGHTNPGTNLERNGLKKPWDSLGHKLVISNREGVKGTQGN